MSRKSLKNNIFLYSLSLSNTINYIFYFPFILLYLFNTENITKINYIQIYIFFIIYDLIRNLSAIFIRKITKFCGMNKIISISLIILMLISFLLFLAVFRSFQNNSGLNSLIIFRIIISLVNISPLFTSKIIVNIFERKEMFKKLKYVDFYEKLNNFLVFVFVYFLTNSKFHFFFLCSFVYNLYFLIIYLIFFKCQDEKNFSLYEEKTNEKIKSNNNQSADLTKNIQKKKFVKRIKKNEVLTLGEDNNFSKSGDKGRSAKRKSSGKIILSNDGKINLEKEINDDLSEKVNENNENVYIENNVIVLTTTNSNPQIESKDDTNNDNNSQFQKQKIDIVNNVPIVSSQRVLNEKLRNNTMLDIKNNLVTIKRKLIFILFILIPSRFLKYLFIFMLLLKSNSLKNIFSIEIHLLFYCGYFFLNIPIDFLNKLIYGKIMKIKSGKKILLISSLLLSIPSIFGYIFLLLNPFNNIKDIKIQFLFYVLFFVLNFFLKEGLIVVLRIFYTNSLNIGFNKGNLKNMREISNIFACLVFLVYFISLLFVKKNDIIFDKIVYYVVYYFLPIFFLVIIYISTIHIS